MGADLTVDPLAELARMSHTLAKAGDISQKIVHLQSSERFRASFHPESPLGMFYQNCEPQEKLVIASILSIGEAPIVFRTFQHQDSDVLQLKKLLSRLIEIESFYDEIGGIVGYHYQVLKLLQEQTHPESKIQSSESFLKPAGYDISDNGSKNNQYIRWGIENLFQMAEIYPVGGAGDRLNLRDENNGEPLPAAELRFCGRSLLHTLVRDLEAKEYLYYKLMNQQMITPIVMMTSEEKGNHRRILEICKRNHWFGRSEENFFFLIQPLVPVITSEGHWSMTRPFQLNLKPGGHGVIWKLASQSGALEWLGKKNRTKALLRQINNPIAGTDGGILAFCGIGSKKDKDFGFASCPRLLKAAEGMIVLVQNKIGSEFNYHLTNIEYTEFSKQGLEDLPEKPGGTHSKYPANTNILFADLIKIGSMISDCSVPGMLVNFKTTAPYMDPEGKMSEVRAGRLESMMQNISDCLVERKDHSLNEEELLSLKTFITYGERRKTISVTKNAFDPQKTLKETPPGCFYELISNNRLLFSENCRIEVPQLCSEESYIAQGPNILITFHPALGPLYSIISQKIRGGRFHEGSEITLEIAEIDMENIELQGSLLIEAEQITGEMNHKGLYHYSEQTGKCELKNIKVYNKGIDEKPETIYWKNQIDRKEKLQIILKGNGEFFAENVTFCGNHSIVVPNGYRFKAIQKGKHVTYLKEPISSPSWSWNYAFDENDTINLVKTHH